MKRTRRAAGRVAAERIEHRAVGAAVKRIEREVAPPGVLGPVVGEGDGGVPAVRLHVLAQCGHLVGMLPRHHRYRSVRQAGWHGLEAHRLGRAHHLLRERVGGDVHIDHRPAGQRVAHRASHGTRGVALRGERDEDGLRLRAAEPFGSGQSMWEGRGHGTAT
jgi:hypothetical protein